MQVPLRGARAHLRARTDYRSSGPTQLTVQVGKDEQLNSTLSALANDSLRCDMLGTRAAYSEGGMTTPQVKESLGQVALEVI